VGSGAPGTSQNGNLAGSGAGNSSGTGVGSSIPLEDAGAGFDAGQGGSPGQAGDATTTATADGSAVPGKTGSGYQINLSDTSVSGFSSGAFFAVQFHVAFSSILKGAAIFAGGPYDCAQDSESAATGVCLTGSPNAATLVNITKQNYSSGLIDNPANLANEKVFLFGGADDNVVDPTVVDSLNTYYSSFITTSSSIQYVSRYAGTDHTMPTTWAAGSACDNTTSEYHTTSPYVGNCNYDGAGMALKQIFGTLNPAATMLSGQMHSFSQATFLANPTTSGLAETGYYYVPASCASGAACKVHISFHGCEQTAGTGLYAVGDAYYDHAGYNEWADTNNIIVLYPQASTSSGNDYACWDFWGYDGASYDTQKGTQLTAVRAMLGWLAAGGATDGGTTGTTTDGGSSTPPVSLDAGSSSCVTATNPAQIAAGRAKALSGYAYAVGSDAFLGANTAATSSSLEEVASGYYTVCLGSL